MRELQAAFFIATRSSEGGTTQPKVAISAKINSVPIVLTIPIATVQITNTAIAVLVLSLCILFALLALFAIVFPPFLQTKLVDSYPSIKEKFPVRKNNRNKKLSETSLHCPRVTAPFYVTSYPLTCQQAVLLVA